MFKLLTGSWFKRRRHQEYVSGPEVSAIRRYVEGWADQKLCAVMAFAEAGKMDYRNFHCCLVGVASSTTLHVGSRGCTCLFNNEKHTNPLAMPAEGDYIHLAWRHGQKAIDRRLVAIIKDILAERECQRAYNCELAREEEQLAEGLVLR